MKKILLVLAMTLTGFLTIAQNTITKGTYSLWNMDTIGYQGVTSETTVRCADSKVINVPTNYALVMQLQFQTRAETPVLNNCRIMGSMDNVAWTAVPLSHGLSTIPPTPGTAVFTKSQSVAYTGSIPTYVPGAYSVNGWVAAPTVVATGDTATIVFGATPAVGNLQTLYVTINQPTYLYYKVQWCFVGSANTNGKHSSLFARYYLRKPY